MNRLVHRELERDRCTVIQADLVDVGGTGCQVGGSACAQGREPVLIRSIESERGGLRAKVIFSNEE